MNSETGTPVSETLSPVGNHNRTLVIGLGSAGTEICRSVIEYSSKRVAGEQPPDVQYMCVGLSANSLSSVSGKCSFVKLKNPGNISAEDYAILKAREAWSWLPEPGPSGQAEGARYYSRMALFNSSAEIQAELLRVRKFHDQYGGSPLTIFVAADAGEPEGSAIFLDMAALAYDAFGSSGAFRFYGMLLIPGYGSTPRQRADAYALLKETDFFIQGGRMRFVYPNGSAVFMSRKILSNGNVFILDRQQYNSTCAVYDRMNIESSARFIDLMTIPAVSEFAAEYKRAVPGAEGAAKPGVPCWSSFGIYSSLNPDAALKDAVTAHAAAAVLDEFFKPVDPDELLDELERIKKIPGNLCGPSCADILRKVHPLHGKDIESVTSEIRGKIDQLSAEEDDEKTADTCRSIADTYSAHGIERFRYGLVSPMEIRASIELEKIKILLLPQIYAMVNDPIKGFFFTLAALDSMSGRLSSFHSCFSSSAVNIKMYTADEMLCGIEENVTDTAEALVMAASFNYGQFVNICMIEASMAYLEKFIIFLRDVRESLSEKIIGQAEKLRDESRSLAEDLVRCLNGSVSGSSIAVDHGSTISLETILSHGIDISGIARLLEPASMLTAPEGEGGGESTAYIRFRDRISEAVNSFMNGEISVMLPDGTNAQDQVNRMQVLSEPAINFHSAVRARSGKVSALFTCDPFPGDLLHETRGAALNNGMLKVITCPDFKLSREAVMVSLVSGFNLRDVNRLEEYSESYHELNASKEPLHIFNSTENKAICFPDPLGHEYMEPARLWSALILLKLIREENGIYTFDESLHPILREIGAGGKYKKAVHDAGLRLMENGTAGPAGFKMIADAVNMLGMLAKVNGGGIVFRREYASAIRDILEAQSFSHDDGSVPGIQEEVFTTTADIAVFLGEHPLVADFILNMIKLIIAATGDGSAPGAFMMLPASGIAQTPVPSFGSTGAFTDYCLEYGSPGFYSAVKNILIVKFDEYISVRFVKDSGSPESSVTGIAEFLRAVEYRVPLCVINGVKEMYGIGPE